MRIGKGTVVARDLEGEIDEKVEHKWILGQWNHSVGNYSDGYMLLYMYQNP